MKDLLSRLLPAGHRSTIDLLVLSGLTLLAVAVHLSVFSLTMPPWLQMTLPVGWYDKTLRNGVTGYALAVDGQLLHRENFPSFDHVLMLLGAEAAADKFAVRPVFALVASVFFPFLDATTCFVIANALGWIFGVLFCALFAVELCKLTGRGQGRRAGLLAGALAMLGSGFWYHFTDFSAHLWAFTTYFGGAYAILKSRVWQRQLAWVGHLALGAVLAFATLAYNTALGLLLTYIVAALAGRNDVRHVAVAVALALAVPAFWPTAMNALSVTEIDYRGDESRYLMRAIDSWRQSLSDGTIIGDTFFYASQFITADFIWFVCGFVGLLALGVSSALRFDLLLVLASMWLLPLAISLVWAPAAGARGYLVFQGQIVAFAALAVPASTVSARSLPGAGLRVLVAAAVLSQAVLLYSAAQGNPLPSHLFIYGAPNPGAFAHVINPNGSGAFDMTGVGPSSIEGIGSIVEAMEGSLEARADYSARSSRFSFRHLLRSMAWRQYLVLPLVLLLFALHFWSRSPGSTNAGTASASPALLIALGVIVAIVVVPPAVAQFSRAGFAVEGREIRLVERLKRDREVRILIHVSESAANRLRGAAENRSRIVLTVGNGWRRWPARSTGEQLTVRLGEEIIFEGRSGENGAELEPGVLIRALDNSRQLSVDIPLRAGSRGLPGWQRSHSGIREGTVAEAEHVRSMSIVPSVEFRVSANDDPGLVRWVFY